MSSGAKAYYNTATKTMTPRELEASLLLKAAGRLQAVRDDWDGRRHDLQDALDYNRKLWIVLLNAIERPENPLPLEIKRNVAGIAAFILRRTVEVMLADPDGIPGRPDAQPSRSTLGRASSRAPARSRR